MRTRSVIHLPPANDLRSPSPLDLFASLLGPPQAAPSRRAMATSRAREVVSVMSALIEFVTRSELPSSVAPVRHAREVNSPEYDLQVFQGDPRARPRPGSASPRVPSHPAHCLPSWLRP